MITLSHEDLKQVAALHKLTSKTVPLKWCEPVYSVELALYVQPKERPRSGKSGHFYTPKKTQDCERTIQEACADAPLLMFPIAIGIEFTEATPKVKSEGARWLRPSKGDVDNKVKTVTDALNGILYRDDKQICDVRATRVYGASDSFSLDVYRAGLTDLEWENVRKFLPYV